MGGLYDKASVISEGRGPTSGQHSASTESASSQHKPSIEE